MSAIGPIVLRISAPSENCALLIGRNPLRKRRWHMLRLHRVGIGTFAAMFGLMVLGSSVLGEDDPFAKLMPRKVGSSACFHRDYDAAHLKQHPRQATQSIVMSLKYEIPESLHPSARVMMRRKGAKEPFYVAAGCGWGEHSAKDAKAAQRLLGAMRDPSGLDCTAIEFTTSAREAGFFTIDLSSDMRSMVVAFEDFVAAWRGMSQEKPAPDLALGPQVSRVPARADQPFGMQDVRRGD